MKFAAKKYIKSKKNLFIFVVLIFAFFLFFFWNINAQNWPTSSVISSLQTGLQATKQGIDSLTPVVKQASATSIDKQNLRDAKQKYAFQMEQVTAFKKKDYNLFFKLQNQMDKIDLQDYENVKAQSFGNSDILGAEKVTKDSIAWYNAVLKSGQDFPEVRGMDTKAFGIMYDMSMDLSGIAILVIITLLCSDFLSNEFSNGLRFYEVIREKRSTLLMRYTFIPIVITFLAVMFVYLVEFIVTGFWFGWGSPTFPYSSGSYLTTPMWQIGAWSVLYLVLALFFLTSLGQLVGVLTKRPYLSAMITVILLVGYSQLEAQKFMENIVKWIPLTYLGSGSVFQYSGGFTLTWPFGGNVLWGQNSLWIGALYLLACGILFYVLTHIIFSRYIYRRKA